MWSKQADGRPENAAVIIMMTINVGNEQRVTSLAGRTMLVLKGRESGVG